MNTITTVTEARHAASELMQKWRDFCQSPTEFVEKHGTLVLSDELAQFKPVLDIIDPLTLCLIGTLKEHGNEWLKKGMREDMSRWLKQNRDILDAPIGHPAA